MKLSKVQRAELRAMFGGLCAYCGCDLPEKWHADHIEPVMRDSDWVRGEFGKPGKFVPNGILLRPERDHLGNYFPSCRACNIDKSCSTLEDWRESLERRVDVCRRNHSAFRHAERFSLVAQIATTVVFHFEKVQQINPKTER